MVTLRYALYSKQHSKSNVPLVLKPQSEHSPSSVLAIPTDRFRCTHRMRARRESQNAARARKPIATEHLSERPRMRARRDSQNASRARLNKQGYTDTKPRQRSQIANPARQSKAYAAKPTPNQAAVPHIVSATSASSPRHTCGLASLAAKSCAPKPSATNHSAEPAAAPAPNFQLSGCA